MVLAIGEGGLGVRNLLIIAKAVDIKRLANFWSLWPSILADWKRDRYIRGQTLDLIQFRPNVDSTMWKHILTQKEDIMKVLEWNQLHSVMEER